MFDDLMERKDDIRRVLLQKIKKEKLSMRAVAQEIGVSPVSLQRFLIDKPMHYVTLLKIEEYCYEKDKSL